MIYSVCTYNIAVFIGFYTWWSVDKMGIQESYIELENMFESMYEEIGGYEFYRYLFPDCEEEGELNTDYSRPNAIYLYEDDKDKGTKRRLRRRIMLKDTWEKDYIDFIERNNLTLCSGLTYRRKANKLQNAQRMNALVFDLDGVGENEMKNLLLRFGQEAERIRTLPQPTFLVLSGAGLHIYYVFEEPIDLYPNIKLQLKALKYDLTFRMWEYKATSTKKEIQYQSINQSFRMVGSVNGKYGNVVKAYKTGEKVTLEYLNRYVKKENQVDVNRPFRPSKMTRAEAREKYPEWYERVIVNKSKQLKKWDIYSKTGYALYNWWLGKIGEVRGGHRYYYMMCLAIYACKCDVPKKKLKDDIYDVYSELSKIQHDNVLTEDDITSALEAYDKEYYNFTIADIEKVTDIRIERNKRNYQKQIYHLEEARAIRDIRMRRQGKDWREGNGRPTKEQEVIDYIRANPDSRKCDVIRGTGFDKKTVYKYYDKAKEMIKNNEKDG